LISRGFCHNRWASGYFSLKRGNQHYLILGSTKSRERAMAEASVIDKHRKLQ
jgi:hypothetical protein